LPPEGNFGCNGGFAGDVVELLAADDLVGVPVVLDVCFYFHFSW